MFAVATIDQGRTMETMLVPARAVIEDANTNSYRVFVIEGQQGASARRQLAARGAGDSIRILSGIQESDRLATSNLAQLYDGVEVTISKSASDD